MDDSRSDLLAIDRMVKRAALALGKFRKSLREASRAEEIDETADPLSPFREVAGASAVERIKNAKVLPYETMIQDGLVRWTAYLTDARVGLPLEMAWAKAVRDPVGRFDGDPPELVSYREAFRRVLSSRSEGEADRWLAAAAECAPNLRPIVRERRERSVEVSKRLAPFTPEAASLPVAKDVIVRGADAFLRATDDLAADQRRRQKRPWGPSSSIYEALAREAGEGWPARPTTRFLEELFAQHTAGLTLSLPPMLPARGAASFAVTLEVWGESFRRACPAASLPFSLAHEPEFVSAVRCGLLFGSLPTHRAFHKRALGTGDRVAHAQARSLSTAALLEARRTATALVLEVEGGARFAELTEGLLGVSLDARFEGVFPASFAGAATRALALLTLLPLRTEMQERFDEDWFRNPKAFGRLRADFAGPARETFAEWDSLTAASALAREFEKALG